jgi:hypothetical protein
LNVLVLQGGISAAGRLTKETLVPDTFSLTTEQLDELDRFGVLRLPRFYPAHRIREMAARLWADLAARYGAIEDDPKTWTIERAHKFQPLVRSGAFNGLDTPDLRTTMDDLVGAGAWDPPRVWGQPLVTYPSDATWDLRRLAWHTDYPATPVARPLAAARFFVCLAPVRPRGGATLVVRGSHLAMMDLSRKAGAAIRSADARRILETRSSWLRALFSKTDGTDRVSRFMESDGDICGFPVRVVELTGEPGDLILMHPGMLHSGSPNVLDRPRLMLVQSIVQRDWMKTFVY